MIVVDTNTIAYLYLEGPSSSLAEVCLQKDPEWAAPLLWRSEFRNILALYLRKEILSLPDTIEIAEQAEEQMKGREYAVPSPKVLELCSRSNRSAYDCEFVQLASDLGVPLVTSDRALISLFPKIAVALRDFAVK